ncbi:hypothetical protein [Lachnobacterium bovis]|uniref:Uncharacterized protein n=1 Tax=Lachnobacterium bovis TaxID=140626 RepID=A0A1H9V1Y4_9FIRM|nr:hypothetical protein [Lachnobacterium bovis]SES15323.1 hypothetical protein SAMN02910429_02350 [Lachnobacterium bovis]
MKKLINKDNKKKKIIMVCVVLLLITIVYFVPFDFKYVKLRKGYPSVGLSSVEYAERSRTLDDSVCVVLKREGECQKEIQRVSSNQLVSFKYEMSQRKFDFFTTLKCHYYNDKGHNPIWQGVKLPYEDIEKPRDILAKIDCLKIQYYDIDKNKLYKEEDLLPWLKKYDKNNALYGLYIKKIGIVNTNNTVIYCDGKDLKSKTNGYQVYEHVYPSSNCDYKDDYNDIEKRVYKEVYMDADTFKELLKENGIKTEGIDYYEGSDLYGELNMDINTEDLPNSNAKLYKVYPGLKKYIGQKGKKVQLHLSGINNPDILVGYFLPDGKKVTYGKKGIKIVGGYFDDKREYKGKTCKSFQEYLKIQKQVKYDFLNKMER